VKSIAARQNTQTEMAVEWSRSRLTFVRARASSVARVLLALVFLLSGISKLHSPGSASAFLENILPVSPHVARVIVIALSLTEVAAGCLFLLNRWVTSLALLSSLFFLSAFTAGLLFLGQEKPCGCFGDLFLSQTDEWFVLRSLALLFLSLFVLRSNFLPSITDDPANL
jgi:uncharacterized membrane protein YphA (DoxX/SURF4 family)